MASKSFSISKGTRRAHMIDLDDIEVDYEFDTRQARPSKAEVRSLAEDILSTKQQLQAIGIRKDKDRYVVVYGFTRCEAVALINTDKTLRKKAGLAEGEAFLIKAQNMDIDEKEAILASISENAKRANTDPVDDAYAQSILRDKYGYKNAEIARIYGIDPSWVSHLSKIMELSEDERSLIKQSIITASTGILMSKLDPEKRSQILDECESEEEIKEAVEREVKPKRFSVSSIIEDIDELYPDLKDEQSKAILLGIRDYLSEHKDLNSLLFYLARSEVASTSQD